MIFWDYNSEEKTRTEKEQEQAITECRSAAIQYLAARHRSSGQLKRKLETLGFGEELIDEVIPMLETDYLFDQELAETVLRERRLRKAESHLALRHRLNNLGIKDEIINNYLESHVSDKVLVVELLENKFPELLSKYFLSESFEDRQIVKIEIFRKAQNRGFSFQVIESALNGFRE